MCVSVCPSEPFVSICLCVQPCIRPSVHSSIRPRAYSVTLSSSVHLYSFGSLTSHPSIDRSIRTCLYSSDCLPIHLSVHLCICASMHPCIRLSQSVGPSDRPTDRLSVGPHVHMFALVCPSAFICLSVRPPLNRSARLSVHPCIRLHTHLSVYLCISMCIHASVHASVRLSVRPAIDQSAIDQSACRPTQSSILPSHLIMRQ